MVYCLWYGVGAYEGADVCVGIYSDYVKAYAAQLAYQEKFSTEDVYITKVELDRNEFDNYGDAIGEVL